MDAFFTSDHIPTSSSSSCLITPDHSSTMSPLHTIDPSATSNPLNTTIKMEDLHASYGTPAPSSASTAGDSPQPSPQTEGKQVKKRKSWGQVLPEPKTSLPPRKRAKTEDEKEQRRIERVKRNRLAAHNSRERKRQEYEVLQAEKDQLEADLVSARETIARMNMELNAFRSKYPTDDLSTSSVASSSSDLASVTTDTVDPSQTTSSSFPSPVSMTLDNLDSPRDSSCAPETPSFNEATPDFDQTRYPAEILCDLQCRSTSAASLPAIWAFLSLFNLTLPTTMKSLSSLFSTSTSSQTPLWNPLLALLTATSSSPLPSSHRLIPTLAQMISLMQSTSICRQPLAQLTLATGLSQRRTSIDQIARSWKVSRSTGHEVLVRQRRLRSLRLRQMGDRRKRTSWALRRVITRALGRNQEVAIPKSSALAV
ncbi:unnamed protein product [Periconia digitata]|uniref:BZIP domain-containing protein n=1 Tax=Periconia digitata TaxID=1303443 RepID=A0A9W4UTA9_9PLEO|nr:unnamed protein product [Periconia digitata]